MSKTSESASVSERVAMSSGVSSTSHILSSFHDAHPPNLNRILPSNSNSPSLLPLLLLQLHCCNRQAIVSCRAPCSLLFPLSPSPSHCAGPLPSYLLCDPPAPLPLICLLVPTTRRPPTAYLTLPPALLHYMSAQESALTCLVHVWALTPLTPLSVGRL